MDDVDPVENTILEDLGTRVGKDSERFRHVHFFCVDDPSNLVREHPVL